MKKSIPWIITLVAIGIAIYFARKIPVIQSTLTIRDTFTIYKDCTGITHTKIEHNPIAKREMKDAITKEYYSYTTDTLAPALAIAYSEIDRLLRVEASLKGQLSLSKRDSVITSNGIFPTSLYSGKYMTITVRDTVATYSYDARLDFVDYSKKNWLFGRDKYYTDISSPDTAFKIYGVQSYRKSFSPIKDKLAISATAGLSLGKRSSIQTGVKVRLNPDGILSPYFGAGREFFFNAPAGYYVNGGVQFNIYRK